MEGLEPPCLPALDPKSSASTYFATSAAGHTKLYGNMNFITNNNNPASKEAVKQGLCRRYRVLYRIARPCMQAEEAASLQKAVRFLVKAYEDRSRPSGEPYVEHPMEVASIMAEKLALKTQAIIGALLHDVIVETPISEAVIEKEFGRELAKIVVGVTQLASAPSSAAAERTARFKRILSDSSPSSITIILISLADCLHHLHRIDSLPADQQQQLVDDAKRIYAPLLHRLGLEHMHAELADLQFKFTHRALYEGIVRQLRASSLTQEGFLARFIAPIRALLQELGLGYRIQGRTKSVASIDHKMKTRHMAFEDMYDLYAIRIVFASSRSDEQAYCWLVYEMLTKLYEPVHDRTRDWLSYPKSTGYEALHLTVASTEGQWVEVQIRSARMDQAAEDGEAAHWKYKGGAMAQELADIDKAWLRVAKQFLPRQGKHGAQFVAIHTSSLYVQQS